MHNLYKPLKMTVALVEDHLVHVIFARKFHKSILFFISSIVLRPFEKFVSWTPNALIHTALLRTSIKNFMIKSMITGSLYYLTYVKRPQRHIRYVSVQYVPTGRFLTIRSRVAWRTSVVCFATNRRRG